MSSLFKWILGPLLLCASFSAWAEDQASVLPPNMMACLDVVKMSSGDFIKKYTQVHGDNPSETVKAIYQYGNCYDQALAAERDQLEKDGRGPLMGAVASFVDFERALDNFVATAQGFCSPTPEVKRLSEAYATLYQKHFRHLFYQQYRSEGKRRLSAIESQNTTVAKAALDRIINKLPPSQAAPARTAFDAYFKASVTDIGLPAQPVYEYAIRLLQSPTEKPFSAAPF